jgi:Mg/Co/Ni transporter MgtE
MLQGVLTDASASEMTAIHLTLYSQDDVIKALLGLSPSNLVKVLLNVSPPDLAKIWNEFTGDIRDEMLNKLPAETRTLITTKLQSLHA